MCYGDFFVGSHKLTTGFLMPNLIPITSLEAQESPLTFGIGTDLIKMSKKSKIKKINEEHFDMNFFVGVCSFDFY